MRLKCIQYSSVVVIMVLLAGCINMSSRLKRADTIAGAADFSKTVVPTHSFILTAYTKITDKTQPVHIYIEGDGLAWITKNQLSSNPTPDDPVMLRLAVQDSAANVVYLGRPCQYTPLEQDSHCESKYWSKSRFAEEVIASMNEEVDHFAAMFETPEIHLIGYSGGAGVAALIAARRSDVASLRTVAGNLDHVALSRYNNVSLMEGSLNPIDVAVQLATIAQRHFIGENDKIIPAYAAQNFVMKVNQSGHCATIRMVPGATHFEGWSEHWVELLAEPVVCANN